MVLYEHQVNHSMWKSGQLVSVQSKVIIIIYTKDEIQKKKGIEFAKYIALEEGERRKEMGKG